MDIHVAIDNETGQDLVADEIIEQLVCAVLLGEGCPQPCEISVSFISSEEMQRLNSDYRGIDRPTDVLSFAIDDPDEWDGTGDLMLGDVMVCPEIVEEQVPGFGNTAADELCLLIVHGCLHLMGYDHEDEDEAEEMEARERYYLEPFASVSAADLNVGPTADHAAEDAEDSAAPCSAED